MVTGFPAPSLRSVPGMTARYDSNFGNADLVVPRSSLVPAHRALIRAGYRIVADQSVGPQALTWFAPGSLRKASSA